MTALHLRTRAVLHRLDIAGTLIHAPVALPGDEHRRHVDGAAGEDLQLAGVLALSSAAVPLQATLEPNASVLAAIERELLVRQPFACSDLCGGRHLGSNRLRHVPIEIHDV